MELRMLHLSRETYGESKGRLKGKLSVTTSYGEIDLKLEDERAEQILQIVADQLVESAKEVAQNITREVLEHQAPALEHRDE